MMEVAEDGLTTHICKDIEGIEQGPAWTRSDTGALVAEFAYLDGRLHGVLRFWNEDGSPRGEQEFANGAPVGVWRLWDDRGNLLSETDYGPAGYSTHWSEGSRIWMHNEMRHGELHGRATIWHRNGQKAQDCRYQEGKRHGRCRSWHPNGQARSVGEYRNGKVFGGWLYWEVDGEACESWACTITSD